MNRENKPEHSPLELLRMQEQSALESYNGLAHNFGLNPNDAEMKAAADAAYDEYQRIRREAAALENEA